MPLFRFEALAENGKKKKGTIDAESLHEAKLKLVRLRVAVLRVSPLTEKEKRLPLKKRELLIFTKELARLLHAGLPLFEALSALEEKYRDQRLHPLLLDLSDRIRTGEAFSDALAHHPGCFDLLYIAIIANAEKMGRLEEALNELSELLRRQIQIRKTLLSALLYPSFLFLFSWAVLSLLLFFVIPSLSELFEGRDLHPFTQAVFTCSHLACQAKGGLALFLVSLLALSSLALVLPSWKRRVSAIVLRLPFLKTLFVKVALIRFCRAGASLLEGGLPLVTCLREARSVMRHPPLEALIANAEERLVQGEPLSRSFASYALLPPLVPRMLAIAEQSGKLSFTFEQIAQIYEDEVETALAHFTTLAQPLLLLFLGALVGFVLLSVLLPLTDVSSFVN